MKNNPLLVSVCMITYNHEKFIAAAIEGVLVQEVDFEVELIIADDASTDCTGEVIQSYIDSHPRGSWIKYTRHPYNKGMMGNFIWALGQCKGGFIALCEGDDFWTDSLKLRRQVEYLMSNLEYSLSFHNARVVDEQGQEKATLKLPISFCRDYSSKELIGGLLVPTLTVVFRNGLINEFPNNFQIVKNGDTFLFALLGQFGKGKFHPDIFANYREHNNGVWTGNSLVQRKRDLVFTLSQLLTLMKKNNSFLKRRYLAESYELAKLEFSTNRIGIALNIYKSLLIDSFLYFYPKIFILSLIKLIIIECQNSYFWIKNKYLECING